MSGASASVPDSPYWPNPNPNPNPNQCAFVLQCACPFRPHHHAHAPVPRLLPPGHGGQLSPCCNRVERPHPKGSGDMAGHFLPLYCLLPLDCPCIALVSLLIAFVSPLYHANCIANHCQPLPTIANHCILPHVPEQPNPSPNPHPNPNQPFLLFYCRRKGQKDPGTTRLGSAGTGVQLGCKWS